jgi:ligand-binding sensor domain-containing protein
MRWILFILISVNCCHSAGQPLQFTTYTTKDGLSSNTTTCIAKTREGFLWIGTNNGLNRFDGNAFDVFINNPGDSTTIADNNIQCIYTDSKSRLWITTSSGLSMFNHITQQFSNYAPDTLAMPKIGSSFPALCEDARGNIWLGADYDLLVFDPATKKFSSSGWAAFAAGVKPANGNHTRVMVLSLVKKDTDELWVFTTYGLFSVNTLSRHFVFYPCADTEITDFFGNSISYVDEYNNLWIGTYNQGLLYFNTAAKRWKRYTYPAGILKKALWHMTYGVKPMGGDTLVVCANNCLVLFDKRKEVFLQTIDTATNNNFPKASFYNIVKDSNQYWLLTGSGLVQMKAAQQRFRLQAIDALSNGTFRIGFSPVTGALVMGEYFKKTIFYNPVTKTTAFVKESGKAITAGFRTYSEFSSNEAYLSTIDDAYLVNPMTMTATRLQLPDKVFSNNGYYMRNAVKDAKGEIWLRSSEQGIIHYQPKSGKMEFASFITPAQDKEYNALYCDSASNTLFVSVKFEGLYMYDINKKTVQNFRLNILPSQKGAIINTITGDKNGNIYLAAMNNGFFVYAVNSKTFTRYTAYDGLASNNCFWLAVDTMGYVWIATETGISRFNPATKKFSNYGEAQGHPGNADVIAADGSGNIYQPFPKGYCTWNSNDFLGPEQTGKIYLRNSRLSEKNIPLDTVYKFSASENNISFQFGYLLLDNDAPVQLEYKLNDADWIALGKDNKISFSNLASNGYQLLVRYKGSGITPLFIKFDIAPPFYKTGWFILLSVSSIILLAYLFVKWREKNIRAIAAEKLKVQQLNAEQYKNKLEVEKIINYFSTSLVDKNKVDDVLWDIAKNLIGRLGFADCMIYLWNADKTKMIQKAGFGPKGSAEEITNNHFDVLPGQGVVGYVMQTKDPVLIPDTSADSRYRPDEMVRLSEITVPVIFNDELIGVIDSEHPEKNFFTSQHLQIMSTIAALMADKIKTIEAEESLQQQHIQMHNMNEQLSHAKLEALRSQMNPHFIFNCISSIDNFILDNDVANASAYLNKFAKLIRNILDNSRNNVVSFWKDWETLRLYTELEQLRADNTFTCSMEADEILLSGHYRIPPLIIQPYVENAIHHGLKHRNDSNGHLYITARLQQQQLVFTIEDDGIGRAKAAELKAYNKTIHNSYGMQLSGERVQLFNAAPGNITITDLRGEAGNATGTRVEVILSV